MRKVFRSEKLQNESCSRNFRIFGLIFSRIFLRIFPKFSRIVRALFPRKRRPEKIHNKKRRPFSMPNPQANTTKIFTRIFWRAGKVKDCPRLRRLLRSLGHLVKSGNAQGSKNPWVTKVPWKIGMLIRFWARLRGQN